MSGRGFAAAIARAAQAGGAGAVRVDGPEDVAAVKAAVTLPVIAIWTVVSDDSPVYITPDFRAAEGLAEAGADMIALDGTTRRRRGGEDVAQLIDRIHGQLGLPVEADVDNVEQALRVREMGADAVGTSILGYMGAGGPTEPDIDLVRRMSAELDRPVIAQRHYVTVEHVREAFKSGAHAVVVGSAINDPAVITRRFVEGIGSVA